LHAHGNVVRAGAARASVPDYPLSPRRLPVAMLVAIAEIPSLPLFAIFSPFRYAHVHRCHYAPFSPAITPLFEERRYYAGFSETDADTIIASDTADMPRMLRRCCCPR
jgi:hypothetical protein